MSLRERIIDDISSAMKRKDEDVLRTLRLARSALENAEILAGRKGAFTDDEIVRVLQKELKKRDDAAKLFRQGGREDLAVREDNERNVLARYLPTVMGASELAQIVHETLSSLGALASRDMGRAMKAVMSRVEGRADGSAVSALVRNYIDKNPTP